MASMHYAPWGVLGYRTVAEGATCRGGDTSAAAQSRLPPNRYCPQINLSTAMETNGKSKEAVRDSIGAASAGQHGEVAALMNLIESDEGWALEPSSDSV